MTSRMQAVVAATGLAVSAAAASGSATLVITEIWAGSPSNPDHTSDWFELSNTGNMPYDLNANPLWYDDDSADPTKDDMLVPGGDGIINPGEAVVILVSWEDDFFDFAEARNQFKATWGALNTIDIGYIAGGSGLGGGGDEVWLFDGNTAGANTVATQGYDNDDFASWIWNPETESWNDELAEAGKFLARESNPTGGDPLQPAIGSPGFIPTPGTAAILGLAGIASVRRRRG
jgi:MYXO-CTERM domain-containing protein